MSHQKIKDLENCAETYEEKEIQLLEDRRAGSLIYFISWYFFGWKWLWNIALPFCWVIAAFFSWLSYLSLRDIYYYRFDDTKTSELFPPLWLTIHYVLAFVIYFVGFLKERANLVIEAKILRKLLGQVSETDLGDPVAWKRIAFNVNQCFVKGRYNSSIFYGGKQCRCYFVKEILNPVDSGSYTIRTYHNGYIYTDYCKNSLNKKMAQKAVANYNKSIEYHDESLHDESLHVDGEVECDNEVFQKFHVICMASILYLFSIEIAFSAVMSLAMVALSLYRTFFN